MILLYLLQKTQNHQVIRKMLNHMSRIHTTGENHKYITRHTLNNTHCSISLKWSAKTGKPHLRLFYLSRFSVQWFRITSIAVSLGLDMFPHCRALWSASHSITGERATALWHTLLTNCIWRLCAVNSFFTSRFFQLTMSIWGCNPVRVREDLHKFLK